jgi:decaprenylphospho-beta-D-erythro-pentofuranosid-2-ulose 2-reductase
VIDALGRPQSVLLIGGTSEIALAILHRLPRERLTRVILLGRDETALTAQAHVLEPQLPVGGKVEVALVEAGETDRHGAVIDAVFAGGDVDLAILAIGILGDQAAAELDPRLAVATVEAGFVGPLSLILHTANHLRAQGHGRLVVLSSIAGQQARRRNYVYGAAKGGLDLAARGLMDALHGSGVRVLLVRPGFVRTRMTAGLPVPPLAVDADTVARAVVEGLSRRRTLVYSPAAARFLSFTLRVAPRWVLRRLPF